LPVMRVAINHCFLLAIEIGLLTNLMGLDLENNLLRSTIPTEFGQMHLLVDLILSGNMLSGRLPSEIGRLTGLNYLWVHDNLLTGSLPFELTRLAGNMTELNLEHNVHLSGIIPEDLCFIETLRFNCSSTLCGCDCGCEQFGALVSKTEEQPEMVSDPEITVFYATATATANRTN
jgi:Leucine-rich repeat (LRR) protein